MHDQYEYDLINSLHLKKNNCANKKWQSNDCKEIKNCIMSEFSFSQDLYASINPVPLLKILDLNLKLKLVPHDPK